MRRFKNGKYSLRALIAIMLTMTMLLSAVSLSFAEGSINDDTNKPYVPIADNTKTGYVYDEVTNGIISLDLDTGTITDQDIAKVIQDVNNGKDVSVRELIEKTNQPAEKTDPTNFPTTKDYNVNLDMYDRITDFYDLEYFEDGVQTRFKSGEVSVIVPETRGMKGSDLMVMIIDKETGEMYLVPPKRFNSRNGLLTIDAPCLGAYCVLHKVPIVVRNVDPDLYPDKELAEIIRNLPYNEVIGCEDFLKALGIENPGQLEVADGVTVNTADYSSAIALSDIAVELNREDFSYDLSAKFKANLYRGNDKVDWERILNYAGVDYDKSAIMEDDKNLTEIEPVKLENCFVYHVDAATREASIIYEPDVCWATFEELSKLEEQQIEEDDVLYWDVNDIDEQNVEDRKLQVEAEEEGGIKDLLVDEAYAAEPVDETYNNDEDVCIVINGDEYLGMGPFLLFMPIEKASFPWWILVLIGAAAVIIFAVAKKKKNDKDGQKEA